MRTIKQIKNEDFKETGACEIGEDGDMVCFAPTKRGAWIKFRRTVRAYCGEGEEVESVKLENIGIGFLHQITDEERKNNEHGFLEEEQDWFASHTKRKNDVEVWFYSV